MAEKEEALRKGERAMELLPVAKHSVNGPHMIEYFALIAAWMGEKELACEHMEEATGLSGSGLLTYRQLKLLPHWTRSRAGLPYWAAEPVDRPDSLVVRFAP